jgi:predicted SAM-dependent methyltransferase
MSEKFLSNKEIQAIKSGKAEINFQEKGGFAERGLDSYLEMFDLDEAELEGKKVLDVGPSLKFQREAKEKNINVVGAEQSFREDLQDHDKFVQGSAQFLPFKDESFDLVLASNSVPLHLEREDNVSALLSIYEMLRVASKDGQVRIFPFTPKEIFEKEGKVVYSDHQDKLAGGPNKQFTRFNLKNLLEKAGIGYDIKDSRYIKGKEIKKKPWVNPGWEKTGNQFITINKTEESNLQLILNDIKNLIKKE